MSVNRRSSHLSNWCLQLTLMLLKVKDTSAMLREGGTPGGSNLGSSSVMVAPRPTGPRSLTVTPIGSSQHLRCCENEVKLHALCLFEDGSGPYSLRSVDWHPGLWWIMSLLKLIKARIQVAPPANEKREPPSAVTLRQPLGLYDVVVKVTT